MNGGDQRGHGFAESVDFGAVFIRCERNFPNRFAKIFLAAVVFGVRCIREPGYAYCPVGLRALATSGFDRSRPIRVRWIEGTMEPVEVRFVVGVPFWPAAAVTQDCKTQDSRRRGLRAVLWNRRSESAATVPHGRENSYRKFLSQVPGKNERNSTTTVFLNVDQGHKRGIAPMESAPIKSHFSRSHRSGERQVLITQ